MYDDQGLSDFRPFLPQVFFLWMVDCDACIEVPNEEASKMYALLVKQVSWPWLLKNVEISTFCKLCFLLGGLQSIDLL